MKKLIAMLLCFAMVAAFGASAAFAAMPDPISAYDATRTAYNYKQGVKNEEEFDKKVDKLISYLKAYETVKYDSSKTQEEVNAAYNKVVKQFRDLKIYNNPNYLTTSILEKWKLYIYDREPVPGFEEYDGWSYVSLFTLISKQNEVWSTYWQSSGTKMDVNARDIGLAKLESAAKLEYAQNAASAAKVSALKAQATAKALIADSIKVAQDAAATAVANAQKDAYNTLASNYADAVEAFWAEVENAWF